MCNASHIPRLDGVGPQEGMGWEETGAGGALPPTPLWFEVVIGGIIYHRIRMERGTGKRPNRNMSLIFLWKIRDLHVGASFLVASVWYMCTSFPGVKCDLLCVCMYERIKHVIC